MIRFNYDKLQEVLTYIDSNKHYICNNSNIYNHLIDLMNINLFVEVPVSRRYTVEITNRGAVNVTVPADSELNDIFNVIYDRPPDKIFDTIGLNNILIDLRNKINNNHVSYLTPHHYHYVINYLVEIAKTNGEYFSYLRSRNKTIFDYNDKRILRRLLILALDVLCSKETDPQNFRKILNPQIVNDLLKSQIFSNLLVNLHKIQQQLQGIYSGYETLNYQYKYLNGRAHCLILGDIHGDMVPVFKIFETRAINFDDLINYDIIFLGDIYDPFNNEFIIDINTSTRNKT